MPGDELVEDDAERVDVAARRGLLAAQALRRDVGRRAAVLVVALIDAEREPEVEQLGEVHAAVLAGDAHEEDVVGLEIAVHDAAAVRVADRARDLIEHVAGDAGRERVLVEAIAERRALEELHHQEVAAALVDAEVGDRDDVRVRQRAREARFAEEVLARRVVGVLTDGQELHREATIELDVTREPNLAHSTALELSLESVSPIQQGARIGRGDHIGHVV